MNDTEILEKLFTVKEEELPNILKEKRNWILDSFYVHYFESERDILINAIKNNNLVFNNINFNSEHFSEIFCDKINELSEGIASLDFYKHINLLEGDVFIEYDFLKTESSAYKDLYPNFYRKISYHNLNFNEKLLNEYLSDEILEDFSIIDLFKCLVLGKSDEYRLLVSKERLDNMTYFCPIISKVVYKNNIDNDLKRVIINYSKINGFEVEELNES